MRVKELGKALRRGDDVVGVRFIVGVTKCEAHEVVGVPERSTIRDYYGQRMWRVGGHLFSANELSEAPNV